LGGGSWPPPHQSVLKSWPGPYSASSWLKT